MNKYEKTDWIELKHKHKNKVFYILCNPDNDDIWVDFKLYSQSMFLCALVDGVHILRTKKPDRTFCKIEWIIDKWGGTEEQVALTIKLKEKVINQKTEFLKTKSSS